MRVFSIVALLAAGTVWAQVPNVIGYHGRLLKADGTPATGTVSMTFSFFAAPTGGAALWSESQNIALTDGYYATYLGSVTPLPTGLFPGQDRYLEISVNGTALSPRLRAGSVAHALSATQARNVAGGTVDAQQFSVGGVQVIDSTGKLTGPATAVTAVAANAPLLSSGGTTPTLSVIACAAGQVLKSTGAGWACAPDEVGSTGVTSVAAGTGITVTGTAQAPIVNVAPSVVQDTDSRLTPSGSVTAYLGATAPAGWVMADGTTASRSSCAGLFGVIGTQYGAGDGSTTFGLPNLNDRRFLLGRSSAETLGQRGGAWDHAHAMTAHSHTVAAHAHGMDHSHGMDHVHGMPHIHTVNAHNHGTGLTTGLGTGYPGTCVAGAGRDCGAHTHNVNGATQLSSPDTGGPNIGNTAGSSAATTTGASTVNTLTAPATTTSSDGSGNTGAANPPFFAVNYIIKC